MPFPESMVRGNPHNGINRGIKMLTVPTAVNSAAVKPNITARRLKWLVMSNI